MNRQPAGLRRATVRLPPDVLRELDRRAAAGGVSRSGLIASVLRGYVRESLPAASRGGRS